MGGGGVSAAVDAVLATSTASGHPPGQVTRKDRMALERAVIDRAKAWHKDGGWVLTQDLLSAARALVKFEAEHPEEP